MAYRLCSLFSCSILCQPSRKNSTRRRGGHDTGTDTPPVSLMDGRRDLSGLKNVVRENSNDEDGHIRRGTLKD